MKAKYILAAGIVIFVILMSGCADFNVATDSESSTQEKSSGAISAPTSKANFPFRYEIDDTSNGIKLDDKTRKDYYICLGKGLQTCDKQYKIDNPDLYLTANTIYEEAKAQKDYTVCYKLNEYYGLTCIFLVAVEKEDLAKCEELPKQYYHLKFRDGCVREMAKRTFNEELCNSILDSEIKSSCKKGIAHQEARGQELDYPKDSGDSTDMPKFIQSYVCRCEGSSCSKCQQGVTWIKNFKVIKTDIYGATVKTPDGKEYFIDKIPSMWDYSEGYSCKNNPSCGAVSWAFWYTHNDYDEPATFYHIYCSSTDSKCKELSEKYGSY